MSERVKIIEHAGHKIVLLDATNLTPDKIVALFPEYQQLGITNRITLYLLDVTNTRSNDEIRETSAEAVENVRRALGEIHIALVGINGIQRIIASAINRDSYFAANIEDAKEWLVRKLSKR